MVSVNNHHSAAIRVYTGGSARYSGRCQNVREGEKQNGSPWLTSALFGLILRFPVDRLFPLTCCHSGSADTLRKRND